MTKLKLIICKTAIHHIGRRKNLKIKWVPTRQSRERRARNYLAVCRPKREIKKKNLYSPTMHESQVGRKFESRPGKQRLGSGAAKSVDNQTKSFLSARKQKMLELSLEELDVKCEVRTRQ
jgi:hypothetical protein